MFIGKNPREIARGFRILHHTKAGGRIALTSKLEEWERFYNCGKPDRAFNPCKSTLKDEIPFHFERV